MPKESRRLTILTTIAPHRFSGAERIAIQVADAVQRRGHRVVFATNGHPGFMRELERHGLQCACSEVSGKLNPVRALRLVRLAAELQPDVIHTHLSSAAWLGGIAGRLLGIPVVSHVHALNTKTCFMRADVLAACSEGVKRHLQAQGVPAHRVRVIYNGIDVAAMDNLLPVSEARRELGITDGQPVIGVTAQLVPRKGHEYLVQAVAMLRDKVPNLLCCLIGEGEERPRLERMSGELGVCDRVRFMGFREDAIDLMQAMDIVILPAVRKEGLGLCLVEAGALGKAVIGSNAPGIDEVIAPEQTGILTAPGSAEALAEAIERLISAPDLRRKMGQAGRARVERLFTLDRMVDDTEELYRELVDGVASS